MKASELKEGDTFEMADRRPFSSVMHTGRAREVREVEEVDGRIKVTTTHCGESYLLKPNDPVKLV